MPWPLRWVVLALLLGFCAAIALWAFDFGKEIAGLDHGAREELQRVRTELDSLRAELVKVRDERDQAQSIANTAGTLVTTERAAQEKLAEQVKQLEAESRALHDDLGFFEKLIPAGATDGVAIRGLQAEVQNGNVLRWQVLVIQANRNASEFDALMELTFTGTINGRSWSATLPGGAQRVTVKQYGRLEGVFEVPAQVQVKGMTARLLQGTTLRATQTVKL